MSKLENIEQLMDKAILNSGIWIKNKALDLTPSILKKSIHHGQELSQQKGLVLKNKISHLKNHSFQAALESKDKLNSLKDKSINAIDQAKQADIKSFNLKKISLIFLTALAPLFSKIKIWYLSLRPSSIATFISLATIGSLTSVTIYVQSNKISKESKTSPASELVEELHNATDISHRPGYYKKVEKQFQVTNIVLPAYIKGNKHLKKLVIDFTFESTNKYIKQYLWKNTYLVQDTLNSNIEPITIDFPLKSEGKHIVKGKIMREMNKMLKRLKIKGSIKNVYIHSMIGA